MTSAAGSRPAAPAARLVSPRNAAALDKEASTSWGLSPFALVEAAGRSCAALLTNVVRETPRLSGCLRGPILVLAGPGNNGADALVMLRALLEQRPYNAAAILSRFPAADEHSPRALAVTAVRAMGVPVLSWNGGENAAELFRGARLVIDGIAGTGIAGALRDAPLEMLSALNARRKGGGSCLVVSLDVPSGAADFTAGEQAVPFDTGVPIVHADYTLAIEPLKTILYTPSIRPYCGTIIPVRGIFPPPLFDRYGEAELLDWEYCSRALPSTPSGAYKYSRGVAELHAGSVGSGGAARLAAAGASAAGAGLVRLVLDDELYPALASAFGGVMALPLSSHKAESRFAPDAVLLGPGWGRGAERLAVARKAADAEASGTPLILDADAIALFKEYAVCGALLGGDDSAPNPKNASGGNAAPHDPSCTTATLPLFHGNAILTPHAGELEQLSGIPKAELLSRPDCIAGLARRMNAAILFKSHVMILAAPDGSLAFIDGMEASLGAGGSGDVLAGLCAGIAARLNARAKDPKTTDAPLLGKDIPVLAAAAAGTLLIAASRRAGRRFYDPLELAEHAAALAGEAWLPVREYGGERNGE